MTQKTISALLIVVVAIAVMFMSLMAFVASTPRPAGAHQQVIDATTVKAVIHADLTVKLDAVCIHTTQQTVHALSIIELAKRGLWLNQEVPLSVWSFNYQGHPLAYMKIWGPYNAEVYVEFSRATMTTIDLDVMGETASFPSTIADPPQLGFWYTFIGVATD